MVRLVRVFGALAFVVWLPLSCGESAEDDCCYRGIADYCEANGCPSSVDEALEEGCRYRDVYYDGDRVVVGFLDGLGGDAYFFRGDELVGTLAYTDVLRNCECGDSCPNRAECSHSWEIGETFFALEDVYAGCADCGELTHCTLCPDYFAEDETPPICPFGTPVVPP